VKLGQAAPRSAAFVALLAIAFVVRPPRPRIQLRQSCRRHRVLVGDSSELTGGGVGLYIAGRGGFHGSSASGRR
jgi:hypothetical protein